ncbi:hypothetical protein F2Q68_00009690 [Brassica cretica]|uniref:Uncharacterized protein n=1 Tax=Brassica cretica TaxID=69181 RepID=A0A8S9KVK3_BRACR|nr:hypothetical protein F2Q68_00009690 [Brassica cretica]
MVTTMSSLCNGWQFTSNHASDDDGRIIIIWKNPASVRVTDQTSQSLTCEVSISPATKFIYTAVYAFNTAAERLDLWVDLIRLHQSLSLDTSP